MSLWFQRHRIAWIAESIRVFGFINREHLQRKFGISQPQASADLTAFRAQHPGRVEYDPTRKLYIDASKGASERWREFARDEVARERGREAARAGLRRHAARIRRRR